MFKIHILIKTRPGFLTIQAHPFKNLTLPEFCFRRCPWNLWKTKQTGHFVLIIWNLRIILKHSIVLAWLKSSNCNLRFSCNSDERSGEHRKPLAPVNCLRFSDDLRIIQPRFISPLSKLLNWILYLAWQFFYWEKNLDKQDLN